MELGKKQFLMVVKKVDFGVYLGTEEEKVLLPIKQVPEGVEVGDPIEVFLYKDSKDRLIATTNEPKVMIGTMGRVTVKEVNSIGAFLDWGLEKDLFLPFKEQTFPVKEGDMVFVALYVDKSERLCATMKVYPLLDTCSPYQKDDQVEGIVYEIHPKYGAYVAVDNKFSACIPPREFFAKVRVGDSVRARVAHVKADGKLDLSLRQKVHEQMDIDGEKIVKKMEKNNGVLPFTDKASPERIQAEFSMSKAGFKRAIGRLLKENRIEITDNQIRLK